MVFNVFSEITTLVAATVKTAIRCNTSVTARRMRITRIRISDRSITATDEPIKALIQRNRGADGTGTTLTPVLRFGAASGAVQGTIKGNYTVEPTAGSPELLDTLLCPTGSSIDISYNDPEGVILEGAVNSNISIELIAAQARSASYPPLVELWIRED